MNKPLTVQAYLEQYNESTVARLEQLRGLVRQVVPTAEESMSYGLIGYKLRGKPLVYFGGFEHHIGFYATPNGHEAFVAEFAPYKQGKGSVQLPLDQPLPLELIKRVIEYRKEQL